MTASRCERGDCDRPIKAHGLCQLHYDKERARHRHREDRVLPTRARNRAVAALIRAHPEEFKERLAKSLADVHAEHALIVELAKEHGVDVTNDARVFRLRRGPTGDDEQIEDRAILQPAESGCPACHRTHDRGHFCPECGTTLGQPVERGTSPKPLRDRAEELLKQRAAEAEAELASWDPPLPGTYARSH